MHDRHWILDDEDRRVIYIGRCTERAMHVAFVLDRTDEEVTFSFEKAMEPVLNEWLSIGLVSFEDERHHLDSCDPLVIERAVTSAIAQAKVERSPFDNKRH